MTPTLNQKYFSETGGFFVCLFVCFSYSSDHTTLFKFQQHVVQILITKSFGPN